jgi:hypothetical protein
MEIPGMYYALSWMRRTFWLAGCATAIALVATRADAAIIDLSLNVFYANPANSGSGGTWEVVAKSDGSGISGLRAFLTNIATSSPAGPRGIVNGSDAAGFSIFASDSEPLGFTELIVGQAPIYPPELGGTEEQSVFYGVGTLPNGAPNYPLKPPGSNSIGPEFTTLTNVQNVPWATGDAFGDATWNNAARLLSGTFNPGVTPGFFQSSSFVHHGTTFTTTGTNKVPGDISGNITASTIVRTNLSGVMLPDYNGNGVVDAADFVLWRKTFGQSAPNLPADGNKNGSVDQDDYNLWRMHFGQVVGAAAGSSPAVPDGLSTIGVPEPTGAALLAFGATVAVGCFRRCDRWSRPKKGWQKHDEAGPRTPSSAPPTAAV